MPKNLKQLLNINKKLKKIEHSHFVKGVIHFTLKMDNKNQVVISENLRLWKMIASSNHLPKSFEKSTTAMTHDSSNLMHVVAVSIP